MVKSIFIKRILLVSMLLSSAYLEAQQAAVLRYSETTDVTTLNPLNLQFDIDGRISDLLFSRLITFDVFNKPQPLLLESLEPIAGSPDSLYYTFSLQKGIMWHPYLLGDKKVSAEELTAKDVVFTFNILSDRRSRTTVDVSIFRGVEAVDDYTVKFLIRRPYDLATVQSSLLFPIIPRHAFPEGTEYIVDSENEDFGNKIAPGTGPYYMVSRSLEKIQMKRNPQYFIPQPKLLDPKRQAYIDAVVMHIDKDYNAAVAQLLTEARLLIPLVPPVKYTELRNSQSVNVLPYNPRSIMYLAYNNNNPVLAKRDVRVALTYATDRKRMLEQIYGTAVAQETKLNILSGPFPTGEGDPDILPLEYNPEKALELLRNAGFVQEGGQLYYSQGGIKQPLVLTLTAFIPGEDKERICMFYQNDLKKIGIKVDINSVSKKRLKEDVLLERNYEVALLEYSFGPNTDIVETLFSRAALKRGADNITGYTNDKIEAILRENNSLTDEERKDQNQKRLHAILYEDCPGTFLFSVQNYAAYRVDRLGGVEIHPFRFFTFINDWYYLKDLDEIDLFNK